MDVRVYYQKIRKIEAEIPEPYVVVVSRETPDGGKPGVMTDVARSLAAKLMVEDQAALASPEEAARFRATAAPRLDAASGKAPVTVPKKQGRRQ